MFPSVSVAITENPNSPISSIDFKKINVRKGVKKLSKMFMEAIKEHGR